MTETTAVRATNPIPAARASGERSDQADVRDDVGAEEAPHPVPHRVIRHPLVDRPPVLVRKRADPDLEERAREAERAGRRAEPRG
jgi:hypothetical protein